MALIGVQTAWAALALCALGLLLLRRVPQRLSRLEALVVALALGRVALAGLALALAGTSALSFLYLAFAAAVAVQLLRVRPQASTGRTLPPPARLLAPAAVLAVGWVVVQAVVGRSALPAADGSLVFHGQHTTNDPLVYLALARRIAALGWPVENPFVAGIPNLGHALWFGELVGLHALTGAGWLDLVFRVRPQLDVASLGLTTFALTRRLGGGSAGAVLSALLLLLGGGLVEPVLAVLAKAGAEVRFHEVWGFSTGFHLPFNPIAPALQTGFAALLLLLRCVPRGEVAEAPSGLPAPGLGGLLAPALAGLLLAAVFEIKLFLWPALLGGVVLAACTTRGTAARDLRVAAGIGALASLPLLAHKAVLAAGLAGDSPAGFALCAGCLPGFALATTGLGGAAPDPALFEAGPSWAGLPRALLDALGFVAALLGVRLAALPLLWGRCGGSGEEAAVWRALAFSALLGAGAACLLSAPPHPVNVAQFAWSAGFGLWIPLGIALAAWGRAGGVRWIPALCLGALALPSGLFFLVTQGLAAPGFARVEPAERMLMQRLAEVVPLEARVAEPSLLRHPHRASPVAWLAGRPVVLSLRDMAAYLGDAERTRRLQALERLFDTRDRDAGLAALGALGARFVYAPAERPLRFDPGPAAEPVARSAAGTVWRLAPAGAVLGSGE